MDTKKLVPMAIGAIATGFLVGVGFYMAQRMMTRKSKPQAKAPETSNFNGVSDWGGNNWLTEEKAQALDSTNQLDQQYFGFNDQYDYVNAPQPFRPNPKGIDFTTGQSWN